MSINEASETKTYESTDDIKLRCLANLQNNDITFTAWTQRVGSELIRTIPGILSNRANTLDISFSGYQDIGIYTCHGYNKYNRRMKSQDIQINVKDQPVFTDNITITDSDRMTEINVDYFSVPKPIKVEWLKNENILYLSEKYIQNNIVTDISLTFHKIKVKIKGYRSTLTIVSSEENDHGNYILRVQNAKGTVLQKIEYFPSVSQNEGKPKSTIIAVVVGVILMSVLTIGGILSFVCIWRKRKENNSPQRTT
ncbi:hypothetical protein KUTeg_006291 [Tegillarca granosa]|uniref:Ig-like domain-containing protein n=1 Tax=Tegillarca granosa TaxID=220873 RepID=A0ABQ9FIA5_TEGGR|nr:hypothetical protein KUTeg_006291 [Tegillarca granosa]